ncbi:MAG: LCP family protein [Coriobacteriia bacterium]|nr:LCP family protein [Coriobacteriia bacterium]
MGRYSNKKSKRSLGRDRMRYEQSAANDPMGSRSGMSSDFSTAGSRIARDAKSAELSTTSLSTAKSLEKTPATLMAERDRRRRRTRKRIVIALSVIGILLLGVVGAGAAYYLSLQNRMTVPTADFPSLDSPEVAAGEPFNLLILGDDARDADELERADTIILMRIDPGTQEAWMVSIPRDTRFDFPGRGAYKINAATVLGGTDLAIEAVEELSGHEIDFVMTVNFWGFEEIVDSIGGIEIDVPIEINCTASDFTPDGRASRIAPGPQVLDGAHALTFVRFRGYQDGDIGRTGAQQLFFRAMLEQMTDVPTTRLPGIANSLADNVTTNFTPMQLLQLARDMRGIGQDDFHTTTLPGEWRSPFIWTDEAEAAVIWNNFGERPFDADPDVESEEEGTSVPSMNPSEVSMTVRNGTMRAGIASEAASIMRARGFVVDEIGNTANQTVYDENMVVYTDNREAAELARQFMPDATRVVQSRGMFTFSTDVLVILGSEWDINQVPVADVISE